MKNASLVPSPFRAGPQEIASGQKKKVSLTRLHCHSPFISWLLCAESGNAYLVWGFGGWQEGSPDSALGGAASDACPCGPVLGLSELC